jgi:hypothetical protein
MLMMLAFLMIVGGLVGGFQGMLWGGLSFFGMWVLFAAGIWLIIKVGG